MRANVWSGRNSVQIENVPDPQIVNDGDAIVRITNTAICGSDLHLYDGYIPTMEKGDVLGQVLFLSDILPTGYMGRGDVRHHRRCVVAVWGAGPVGQFAMASANLLGASKVIAIDRFDYRLQMAAEHNGAIPVNYEEVDVNQTPKDITAGRGPDACIDAVGMEAHHGTGIIEAYDK